MQLDNDLRNIELGNLTITEYFHKINRLADLLTNINAPVDEKNLVSYAINGLGDKYEHVAGIIRHRKTSPTFAQTQSMLLLEESRLARKTTRQSARDPTSSPTSFHTTLSLSLATWGTSELSTDRMTDQATTLPQSINAMTVSRLAVTLCVQ
ncbi:hybrid signal transduction histidine kinase M [Tanacetum coccineum]